MKAVFLDRDGVINENRSDHVKSWEEFRFLPGALEAMALLSKAHVPVFVITNQATINRGAVSQDTVDAINSRMVEEVRRQGGRIDAVAYCPHRPDEQCSCRKPRPGLLLQIAQRYGLDLRDTVVIGDALTDMEAALAVGSKPILVMTGRGSDQYAMARESDRNGFQVAPDLRSAVNQLFEADTNRDGNPPSQASSNRGGNPPSISPPTIISVPLVIPAEAGMTVGGSRPSRG